MAERSAEERKKIAAQMIDDLERQTSPLRDQGLEYEKLAIEYSHRGLQTLTYLNGGALVAIPTALAFFKADIGVAHGPVIATAGCFILGLVTIVVAQACAFFVMARRSEAQALL